MAEKDEARRRLGKLVGQVLHLREDFAVLRADLLALAIDDIYEVGVLAGLFWLADDNHQACTNLCLGVMRRRCRTDDSLRVFGPRSAQAELAQLLLRLGGEGV